MGVDAKSFEELLKSQDSVFTRAQAFELGFERHEIRSRLRYGPWQKLYSGVYLVHSFPPTHEQWCRAALLYAGPHARIWGPSAARLHQLWGFTPRPDQLEVPDLPITVAVPHRQLVDCKENLNVIRCRDFEPIDFSVRSQLPTSAVVSTLIYVAADATQQQLAMAYGDVVNRGHYSSLKNRFLELKGGRAGLERLEELIEQLPPRIGVVKSPLEAWCADVLRRADLWPKRQWKLEHGGKQCFLDFAFPELNLAVETDGRKVHAGDPFFDNDRVRWNWIGNRGWSLIKFTWRHMYDEPYVVGTILERIAALRGGASGVVTH